MGTICKLPASRRLEKAWIGVGAGGVMNAPGGGERKMRKGRGSR